MSEPVSKHERRRNRALTRFAGLVYRNIRRQARRLDVIQNQMLSIQDAITDLRNDLRDVAEQTARAAGHAQSAHALYYDTHCTINGDHIDHGDGVHEHIANTVHHYGGGVVGEYTVSEVEEQIDDGR